jgi:hypothetical protein
MRLLQSFDCSPMLFFKVGHLFFILFIGSCCALLLEIIANTLLGLCVERASGKRRGSDIIIELPPVMYPNNISKY